MKSETVMEGPNLFVRTEIESDYEEDAWDDSQLIKAYDKAVAKAKREILKKIQNELMLSSTEVMEALSDTSGSKNKSKKKKKKKASSKNEDCEWDIGSACRAIYSEDREEYEAEIIRMYNKHWCRVKFIGYNNEQDISVKHLKPSLGKDEIKAQIYYATLVEDLEDSDVKSNTQSYTEEPPEPPQAGMWHIPFIPPQRVPMYHHDSQPPPPPPPPIHSAIFNRSTNQMGSAPFPSIPVGNEALHSMLLSWYMCGYYTGFYQREMKNQHDPSSHQ